jgi:ATP adenylyltransferase
MNKFPYNNGHLLIVPKRHQGKLVEFSPEEQSEMMYLNAQSVEILMQVLNAEGVNCGLNLGRAAGAGITEHLHVHVVPRWNGDTNFLPLISDTRSMPEYLEDTYNRLADRFKDLEN